MAEGGGDGRGAKSYDSEKAWPSVNHSILSGGGEILVADITVLRWPKYFLLCTSFAFGIDG
jgi:hypothetical protein